MKIQGKRSISIFLAVILTLQMMLVSGITAFADGTETPIVPINENVKINGLSLVLNGEIGLTFYVYVDKQYSSGTMEFTFMDKEPITMNITECPQDNSTRRRMATYYLSAIELSEPVTLTVYDADGSPLARKSCSVEDYVDLLLKEGSATEKEENIAKTLINYGHYAQLACSEANGWKIGEDYDETPAFNDPTVDTSVFSGYNIDWVAGSEEFGNLSMSLLLDYKTSLMIYIPAEEKPTVRVNGKEVEAVLSTRAENMYRIEISGINVLNLADVYTVEINDATVKLCAFSYCKLAAQYASRNTVDAMRALYEFYDATDKYLNPKT